MGPRARLLVVLALAGCHARGTWPAAEHRLCQGKTCYQVGALDGSWRVVHREGAEIGFYSEQVGGVIQANATCRDDADAASLDTLTHHLLIGYTDRRVLESTTVELDRREAKRTRLTAKLDGVPVVLVLYVLKRNGCVFDLSYAAPPATADGGQEAFERFVAGFSDTRGS